MPSAPRLVRVRTWQPQPSLPSSAVPEPTPVSDEAGSLPGVEGVLVDVPGVVVPGVEGVPVSVGVVDVGVPQGSGQ
jgi:hypothetical protein